MLKSTAKLQREENLQYQQEYKTPTHGSSLCFLLDQRETARTLHILGVLAKRSSDVSYMFNRKYSVLQKWRVNTKLQGIIIANITASVTKIGASMNKKSSML